MNRLKKRHIIVPLCVLLLLLLGFAAKRFWDSHVWAAGGFYTRSASQLDLRGQELTTEDFDRLQEELPDCEILWDVPFQDTTYSSDTETIRVTTLTQEEVLLLDYFPSLRLLDASQCQDYEALMAFQARRPECAVEYFVTLGGTAYSCDTRELLLTDPDAQELLTMLAYLPELTAVELDGVLPDIDSVEQLLESYPEIRFQWCVSYGDKTMYSMDTALDLKDVQIDYASAQELLRWLPALETADMRGCGLTDGEMMALADARPDCFFLWEMTIGDVTVSTDAQEVDISGVQLESTQEIEALLPYFPNVEKVVMCKCGLDDETMDDLNQRYEDIRFVWSVKIDYVYVRTDATYFYPFKYDPDMVVYTEDLYPLRYCTDMISIDVGHMSGVENCEWAAYMPELTYLVLSETSVSDLTPLSNCKKLVFLELFTTPVTDFSPLVECTALEDLNLGTTYGDPTPLTQMTWLKHLWWYGVDGTTGKPWSNAKALLTEALPNTVLKFSMAHETAAGWRQLENYYNMRDAMGMFYLS